MAEIQKLPKNSKKRDKSNFFSFIFPILLSFISRPSLGIVLCANQKLELKTRITRVTLLWTILDALFEIWGKFVFYPKKDRQFHRWNLHISLNRLFIAFIQCILSSEWSWNSYCSSVCSCPQHVVEWPCGQVGPKHLFISMLSGGDRFDSVMIQSNCGE